MASPHYAVPRSVQHQQGYEDRTLTPKYVNISRMAESDLTHFDIEDDAAVSPAKATWRNTESNKDNLPEKRKVPSSPHRWKILLVVAVLVTFMMSLAALILGSMSFIKLRSGVSVRSGVHDSSGFDCGPILFTGVMTSLDLVLTNTTQCLQQDELGVKECSVALSPQNATVRKTAFCMQNIMHVG